MEATSGNCWIICTLLYLDIFCARSVVVEGYPCFFYCILVFCWHIYFRSVLFLQSSVLFDDTWRKNIRRIVYLFWLMLLGVNCFLWEWFEDSLTFLDYLMIFLGTVAFLGIAFVESVRWRREGAPLPLLRGRSHSLLGLFLVLFCVFFEDWWILLGSPHHCNVQMDPPDFKTWKGIVLFYSSSNLKVILLS